VAEVDTSYMNLYRQYSEAGRPNNISQDSATTPLRFSGQGRSDGGYRDISPKINPSKLFMG